MCMDASVCEELRMCVCVLWDICWSGTGRGFGVLVGVASGISSR